MMGRFRTKCKPKEFAAMTDHDHAHLPADAVLALDPVCGMTVDPATAKWTAEHAGERYFFCSQGCRDKFVAAPDAYLAGDRFGVPASGGGHDHHHHHHHAALTGGTPTSGKWTCPMHPEIVSDGPGDCPICGMALEPMGVPEGDDPHPELVDFTRRLWVSAALSVPLLA